MSQLVSVRYSSLRDDMDKHVDKLDDIIEQLLAMGTLIDEWLAICIPVPSIEVLELNPATASIQTLAVNYVNREDVSARLTDEAKNLKHGSRNLSSAATQCCAICGKTNDNTDKCFLNPLNPNNKLALKSKTEYSNSRNISQDEESEEETESKTKK